jgi:hypothetical protein
MVDCQKHTYGCIFRKNLSLPSRRLNPKGNHVANALVVVHAVDASIRARVSIINFSTRKVGGLRFVKLGRFTFMFCVSREYRPL